MLGCCEGSSLLPSLLGVEVGSKQIAVYKPTVGMSLPAVEAGRHTAALPQLS